MMYAMKARKLTGHFIELHVLASAGTYIKEFVHGDLGRTVPSIGQILKTEADILQLDVTNVFDNPESVDLKDPDLFRITIPK